MRSCAHWLNWQCGIALGAGREKVRIAHCLKNLPLIDASFAAGELSYSKVRAMTGAPAARVATPENEDFLMVIARYGTASHLEKVVAKYQSVQRAMEDKVEVEQEEARKLVYYQDDDGMWIIHARLPAEAGSLLVKAINTVATPVQLENQRQIMKREEELEREEEQPRQPGSNKNVSAETFSQAVEHEDPNRYQQLLQHTRADALVTMAEHFLATCDQQPQWQGLKGSERCQIKLHVDINTLKQQSDADYQGQKHSNLDDERWIPANTARRLACDATLVTVLEDDQGQVLNIGRRARTVPASIRRALTIRDETCQFPGCDCKNVEAHHLRHWADGGETSLANLQNLCRFHHTQLHRGCYNIQVQAPDTSHAEPRVVFSTPSGKHIESTAFPLLCLTLIID